MNQKHILAVHDISCMGRCSLTVALPVISAAGIIVSVMPTAVLSTHTGGFTEYTYRDLTEDMLPIADHWQTLSASFDAIYTGYLGSQQQLDIVSELVRRFKTDNTLVVIDPVMADHGQLYKGFSPDFPQGMRELCNCADVITPNITEALLMLKEPYKEGPYTPKYICEILERLSKAGTNKSKDINKSIGKTDKKEGGTSGGKKDKNEDNTKAKKVVLTGVYFDNYEYGAATYENGEVYFSFEKKIPGIYHGTGDLFASVLTAALTSGNSLVMATDIAVKFTTDSIARTHKSGAKIKYGVNFERGLQDLYKYIHKQVPFETTNKITS